MVNENSVGILGQYPRYISIAVQLSQGRWPTWHCGCREVLLPTCFFWGIIQIQRGESWSRLRWFLRCHSNVNIPSIPSHQQDRTIARSPREFTSACTIPRVQDYVCQKQDNYGGWTNDVTKHGCNRLTS